MAVGQLAAGGHKYNIAYLNCQIANTFYRFSVKKRRTDLLGYR